MKFIYLKENGNFDIAYLVTSMLLKEIQENDFKVGWDETGIRLNRFLYRADPNIDIILFVKWDRVKVELEYRYKLEDEDDYEYIKAPHFKISEEETEKLYDVMNDNKTLSNIIEKTSKPIMITQSKIISDYGWTKSLINKFLPEPTLKKNPYYSCAAPMKMWDEKTVKSIMETPEFQADMQKVIKRKKSAKAAVNTKICKMNDDAEHFIASISIKILPDDELKKRTLRKKQEWYQCHPYYDEWGNPVYRTVREADEYTLDRWIVNYIRHNLVDYDEFLYKIFGKVGSIEAYPRIKTAVLKKIANVYPQYKDECERQMLY